jgi:hypothetical protein
LSASAYNIQYIITSASAISDFYLLVSTTIQNLTISKFIL